MSPSEDLGERPAQWSHWPKNVRLFVLFRVFFNARYYYPIFALLFLDLGLSLGQFAALNGLWAAVIVVSEVPSGALADILGRRKLLRLAGGLMVLEMLCLLVPRGNPTLVLWVLAANRIFSGAAEALASGADEALAFDSLAEDQQDCWSDVLELQMRWLQRAMVVAMLVGAAVYDPRLWSMLVAAPLAAEIALRAPVVLTLLHALVVVWVVFSMEEEPPETGRGFANVAAAFRQTMDTGRWLMARRTVTLVIIAAVFFDHLARQALVVSSDFLTVIAIPKGYLGLLGAFSALTSSLLAGTIGGLSRRLRPATMFVCLLVWLLINTLGLSYPVPYWSAFWITSMSVMAGATGFATSLYLNQLTDKSRRATLLSFKGLAMNLGFGWISLAYAGCLAWIPADGNVAPVVSAFRLTLPYTLVMCLPILFFAWRRRGDGPLGGPGGFAQSPKSEAIDGNG